MKKLLSGFAGLLLLTGLTLVSAPAQARSPIYRPIVPIYPVFPIRRPCHYQPVYATQYQLVLTPYGYVYQPVTVLTYRLVCY